MRNFTDEQNQSMVDSELTKLSGQITNLRKGDVETVELISGQDLLPPVDPGAEYIDKRSEAKRTELLRQKLGEIKQEVSELKPAMQQPAIEYIPTEQQPDEIDELFGMEYPFVEEKKGTKFKILLS